MSWYSFHFNCACPSRIRQLLLQLLKHSADGGIRDKSLGIFPQKFQKGLAFCDRIRYNDFGSISAAGRRALAAPYGPMRVKAPLNTATLYCATGPLYLFPVRFARGNRCRGVCVCIDLFKAVLGFSKLDAAFMFPMGFLWRGHRPPPLPIGIVRNHIYCKEKSL